MEILDKDIFVGNAPFHVTDVDGSN